MSLKIHYSRDWNKGVLDPSSFRNISLQKLQCLSRIVLPFLTLYKMPKSLISYGLSVLNIYQKYGTIEEWNTDLLKDRTFFSLAQSAAEVGSVLVGGLRLGLIVNTAGDLIQEMLSFQDPSTRTLLPIAQVESKILYLASLMYQRSTKLQLASLVLEGCLNLYQTYLSAKEFESLQPIKSMEAEADIDHKHKLGLNVIASLALGILRLSQAYNLRFEKGIQASQEKTVFSTKTLMRIYVIKP